MGEDIKTKHPPINPQQLERVVVTDCGSTTTKALYFEKKQEGWRQVYRGEAPTTVEKPVEDVTVGVLNACTEIEETSHRNILHQDNTGDKSPFSLREGDAKHPGIDLYLSTSSAGGGLQMMVAGVVREMTTESAERAALGAGAIVLEAISADDGREEHERIERIRHMKPDIVLLAGGVDGGSESHVLEMAETLLAASPRPRFGDTLRLPVIYAGNASAAHEVEEILTRLAQVKIVPNVRPTLHQENLAPAREAIHEFFLEHVMSHSPGYGKLLSWTPLPIMPTPAAVGLMIEEFAKRENKQVLCADIGGATTDVFSVFRDHSGEFVFNRTVSANLGMSYSIANVLLEAGAENILRWLPFSLSGDQVQIGVRNKMIRPTSIPQTLEDLILEQAICREALRLSLEHHRSLAVGLSGSQQSRGIADIFSQIENRYSLVDMMALDMVIGSGGVLSHAPNRLSAALMMIDGFGLRGITEIAVDSIFMLPHLGVFSSIHPEAAREIFNHDCIHRIAHALVPECAGNKVLLGPLAKVFVNGEELAEISCGSIARLMLPKGETVELVVKPLHRFVRIGEKAGEAVCMKIIVGDQGLLLDGRRAFEQYARRKKIKRDFPAEQQKTFSALGLSWKGGGRYE